MIAQLALKGNLLDREDLAAFEMYIHRVGMKDGAWEKA
jgi:hypothetical protein